MSTSSRWIVNSPLGSTTPCCLFVLTTNRVDLLEPALAARPGRIDQAIELSLPETESRRRLVELYTNAPLPDDGCEIIRRLDGVAAAFIKELAPRAELVRLQEASTSSSTQTAALDATTDAGVGALNV